MPHATDRKTLRRRYPVRALVRCGRCRRSLGELFANAGGLLRGSWPREAVSEDAATEDRAVRYRCRCGGDYPVTWTKLAAAFAAAITRSGKQRVIWLPTDLNA